MNNEYAAREKKQVKLADIIDEVVRYVEINSDAFIEIHSEKEFSFLGYEDLLKHMLFNLLLNAVQACNGEDRILIELDETILDIIIRIHDSGPGIAESEREKVFEPFFSTKSEGTGLGLPSVWASVESHNGEIVIHKSSLGGACFELVLPKE